MPRVARVALPVVGERSVADDVLNDGDAARGGGQVAAAALVLLSDFGGLAHGVVTVAHTEHGSVSAVDSAVQVESVHA